MLKSLYYIALLSACSVVHGQIYMDMAMDTTMSFQEIVTEAEAYFTEHGKGAHSGYKTFKRWEYWNKRCLDASGKMMSVKSADAMKEFMASIDAGFEPTTSREWQELGPFYAENTTGWSSHLGRLTSLSIDANNQEHILVGSPTGGIWKTLNGGNSWKPITDDLFTLKIYSLAISPHNAQVYFAGTWGGGLLRSLDGGATWKGASGIPTGTRLIEILTDPNDPSKVLVLNEGGNVYYSYDGGESFSISLISPFALYDIEYKSDDSAVVFASGANSFYRSIDGGLSFSEIPGQWQGYFEQKPLMMAVTPADPNLVYALEALNGGFNALYRSNNAGQSFIRVKDNSQMDSNFLGYDVKINGGQAPRDMDIIISDTDPDEIHVGGVMTYGSFDAGITWQQTTHWLRDDPLPFIHADVDKMVYHKGSIYCATDGGLFRSDDGAETFVDLSSGLNIRQFYRMAVSKEHIIVAGSQDNGASRYEKQSGWLDFVGADGMEPVIDKDDPKIIYTSIQYGNIYKTKDGGWTLSGEVDQTPGGFGEWVTPLEQDPILPNTLYQGKRQLYKSVDAAWSWEIISDFKMKNPLDTLMQEVDVFKRDGKVIVCGFAEEVFRTTDGGSTWQNITPSFPFTNVNYISIHPNDPNWIALVLSGTDKRVIQTTNGGNTWTSAFLNLPDVGAECVLWEGGPKNGIYVGMDPGVYYKSSDFAQWQMISDNLPNVTISELEIQDCQLYATTFGRGLWLTDILDDSKVYADVDGDGYGDPNSATAYCFPISGYVTNADDCNDNDPSVNVSGTTGIVYLDEDGDGYGNSQLSKDACDADDSYVPNAGDCDDQNANIFPGSLELCDNMDNDCNGQVDEGLDKAYYRDADGDGYGDEQSLLTDCTQPNGYVLQSGDCDDTDAVVHPGLDEICDNKDNDCNGVIDENLGSTFYRDSDGDGYGDEQGAIDSCAEPDGYVTTMGDCDDSDATVFPGAIDGCDGKDNDCDGVIDENLGSTFYPDSDGDGYGDEQGAIDSCEEPDGYVTTMGDCDDSDATVFPGAIDSCDGKDNDCDGTVDEDCSTEDCDGNFLFIHSFLADEYHARLELQTKAKIDAGREIVVSAGQSVELLPEFEVALGSSFEAFIYPCGLGTVVGNLGEGTLMQSIQLDQELNALFGKRDDLHVLLFNEAAELVYEGYHRVEEFDPSGLLDDKDPGQYELSISTGLKNLWRKITVISSQ